MKIIKTSLLTLICAVASFWQSHCAQEDSTAPTITVWVHGTNLVPKLPFLKNFTFKLPGLQPATAFDQKFYKRQIAEMLCQDNETYDLEHFYLYGWSGKLCFQERITTARALYQALLDLIATYEEKYNVTPRIRIITHSHGGNVALNLAIVQDEEHPLIVNELIVLACPVQARTKELLQADCFERIYAFFSKNDMLQVLDPQGLHRNGNSQHTFSHRAFEHHDNLFQARIKINGGNPMHIDFVRYKFLQHLPRCCKEIEAFHKSVIPSQKHRLKELDVRCKHGNVMFRRKIV